MELWMCACVGLLDKETRMQRLLYKARVLGGVWSGIRSLFAVNPNPRCCHCHVPLSKGQNLVIVNGYFTHEVNED